MIVPPKAGVKTLGYNNRFAYFGGMMFYNKQGALLVLVLLLLSACATPKTTVMRAEKQLVDTPFCVEKNDKVIAPGVLEVIYDGLNAKR